MDAETLYTQIYNQLTEQGKAKRTKHQLDMKLATDTNNTSRKTIRNNKLKILTVNVNCPTILIKEPKSLTSLKQIKLI